MRLIKVRIKNYRAVRDLTLSLGPFTVLVGRSDQGKTCIVQAIKAVFTNPSGRAMIRQGADFLAVGLAFDDNTKLIYEKRKSPGYRLVVDGKPIEYQKMGRMVPHEVEDIARLWSTPGVDASLICFQQQGDPPFLLDKSRSSTEKALNALDAKVYSSAHTQCQSTVRSLKRDISSLTKEEEEWRQKRDVLADIEEFVESRDKAKADLVVLQEAIKFSISDRIPSIRLLSACLICALVPSEIKLPNLDRLGFTLEMWEADFELEQSRSLMKTNLPVIEKELEELETKLFSAGICPVCKQEVDIAIHSH